MTPPAVPGAPWTTQVIYSLPGIHIGAQLSGWLLATPTEIYLTAKSGGILSDFCVEPPTGGCGSVFKLTAPAIAGGPWTETTIYQFKNGADAAEPVMMVPGPGGVFYGAAYAGGGGEGCGLPPNGFVGCGAIFQLTPPAKNGGAWTESVLYAFPGGVNGANLSTHPNSLVLLPSGALIGTTAGNPFQPSDEGSVFKLTPPAQPGETWTLSYLYFFTGQSDGADPYGNIFASANGHVYGLAQAGAPNELGVFYEMVPPAVPGGPWTQLVDYTFPSDEGFTTAIMPAHNGSFYGATTGTPVGSNQFTNATIFKLDPPAQPAGAWTQKVVYLFNTGIGYPGGVVPAPHGIYGFNQLGGSNLNGEIFEVTE